MGSKYGVNTIGYVTPVEPVDDPYKGLAISEKFNTFMLYLYPIVLNIHNKHHVFKTQLLNAMFEQQKLFYEASKSDQLSKLYVADAGLATIREWLRFGKIEKIKIFSIQQYKTASLLIAEVGSMLGAWIKSKKK